MSTQQQDLACKIMDLVSSSLESLHCTSDIKEEMENYLIKSHLIEDKSDKEISMNEMSWGYIKTCQFSFHRVFKEYNINVEGFEADPDHCNDTSFTGGLYKLHARLLQEDEKTLNKILKRVESIIICFELL